MPWNSTSPDGTKSVRANKNPMLENTQYIETTMGNVAADVSNLKSTRDHFWNVDSNFNGRHRFIQSPPFTVGGLPTNAEIGDGMASVLYAKTTNSRVEWFHRNINGIYQFIPSVKTGTVNNLTGSFQNVDSVPANVYGEIFMYATTVGTNSEERYHTQQGFFRSGAAVVQSFAIGYRVQGESSYKNGLTFGNGDDASGLNIRARTASSDDGLNWNYIITYRAL